MEFFNLPPSASVNRVVPKNAFDQYTNTKQKKLITDIIKRISWTHKLSPETVNLSGKDIKEIQVFKIELKVNTGIDKILDIINKAIPYHIIFWIECDQDAYISTTSKHQHPANNDMAVIDWTFNSDWFVKEKCRYRINLKESLDSVFKDFCVQLTGKNDLSKRSLQTILNNQKEVDRLNKEINKLKSAISRSKQFNKKVELNIKLKKLEKELQKVETIK